MQEVDFWRVLKKAGKCRLGSHRSVEGALVACEIDNTEDSEPYHLVLGEGRC